MGITKIKILQSDSLTIPKRLPNQSHIIAHSRPNIIFVKTFCSDVEGCFTRIWEVCGGVPVVDGVCETCEIVKR